MHTHLELDDLIKSVLQEIGEFGLGSSTNRHYKQMYNRFKEFSAARNVDCFSNNLILSFLHHIEENHKTGVIGRGRRNHLRRAALLLKDYVANESVEWRTYTFHHQTTPISEEFLQLSARYISDLRSSNRSENTIQSCSNIARQFLLFLEDHGCSSLSAATTTMVPAFFHHLLATYSPTSIRTVASSLRSFLRFSETEERLLLAVPSRCVRNKPIIPILSDHENDALKKVLRNNQARFRDKAIILLALRTGLRSLDILRIKLTDIDWVNDSITIAQSKTGIAFKVPLTADVGNALSAYLLNERPTTDTSYVFVRSRAPFTALSGHSACYAVLRRAFHQAGIRVGSERKGLHVLRHSVASRMLSKGVPVTTISALLGHADKASTEVYLATDQERMRACTLDLAMIPVNCAGLS